MQFKAPFLHYVIPNFLQDKHYNQLVKIYNNLQFVQKQSDLFHFFQTHELNANPDLQFFKKELSKQMGKHVDLKDSSYNVFASYYFKGDYLLCHDDVIEDRKFAFSYYLQDHPTGSLILYDKNALKPVKTFKVTKNLLVIFEVSNISYHEVDFCREDGRKAVTGWLNIKGLGNNRQIKKIAEFTPNIPKNLIKYPLEEDLSQQQYYCFPEMEYLFEAKKQSLSGPCYERKVTRLQLDTTVVFEIQGYELYSADFFKFEVGNYILLNDSINTIKDEVLDVFLMQLPNKAKDSEDYAINIVEQNGNVAGIPYSNNIAFIVHRKQKHYFVDRASKQFFLGHLIYKKISQDKKAGKKGKAKENPVVKPVNIKQIRQSLINHLSERRQQQQAEQKVGPKKASKKINKPQKKQQEKKQEAIKEKRLVATKEKKPVATKKKRHVATKKL